MLEKTKSAFRHILDFILPSRDSERLVNALEERSLIGHLVSAEPLGESFREALFSYKDKRVVDLIWEFKFYKNQKALSLLAQTLYEHLLQDISEDIDSDNNQALLIPIPSSKKRSRQRGYDPVADLVREIIELDESGTFQNGSGLLEKVRETDRQTKIKNRRERLNNMKGAFRARSLNKISKNKVYVIDDITTTGATLLEARRALLEAGARGVECIAIAH